MRSVGLARRYARALFELASERNILDSVADEMHLLQAMLEGDEELRHFFQSPEQGANQKIAVLENSLRDRFSALVIHFLKVVLHKGRQNILTDIAKEFTRFCDKHYNRMHASAITANPISKKDLADIQSVLAKKFNAEFEVDHKVDPEILGGIIVQVEGKVFDGSLKSQLDRLKNSLLVSN